MAKPATETRIYRLVKLTSFVVCKDPVDYNVFENVLEQMDDVHIRGRRGSLHFIRFPTSEMGNFLSLAKSKGMAQLVTTVCATGGGAYKFEQNFKDVRAQRQR